MAMKWTVSAWVPFKTGPNKRQIERVGDGHLIGCFIHWGVGSILMFSALDRYNCGGDMDMESARDRARYTSKWLPTRIPLR